jgi:putative Ca2+/H+ antiporter (TMEM165/GDT1 family)
MNLRLFAQTFGLVFLAELGDKTQLATLSLAAGGARWSVFLGAATALVATSAIAVLAGEALSRVLSPFWIQRIAGVSFLAMGVWLIVDARA